ncbi:MAG: hypothetical protein WKF97_09270 [Chitinophagaceae bacterium]
MPELSDHIRRIHEKLQQLLKQYSSMQKENEKLKTELKLIRTEAIEKDSQLELLSLRLEVLKASKGEMTEEEKRSFEKRINQYLKEVDKCIGLLNE